MNNNRARQFLPFNGLRGYDELLYEAGREKEEKREITEDHAWKLSGELQLVERKMTVTITYYDVDTYRTITGKVEQIDKIFRVLQVAGKRIYFEDVWEVKVISAESGDSRTC